MSKLNISRLFNNKPALILIIIFLLAAFIVYLNVKDRELVKRERHIGFSTEVTQSRYSILQDFLNRMGLDAERHVRVTSIKDLGDTEGKKHGVVFIGILPDRYSEDELSLITNWVESGGHLIINAEVDVYYQSEIKPSKLLEQFNITRNLADSDEAEAGYTITKDMGEKEYKIHDIYAMCNISTSDTTNLLSSEENLPKFIQIEYKRGIVSILNSTNFLDNNNIINNDHALFAYDLFSTNNEDGKVWIVEQPRMPHFTELIWDYYRNVVISCMVLLAVFIFKKSRRFGSIIKVEETSRRSLLEQIHAAGLFAVKTKTLNKLVERVRTDIKRKIERKHPTVAFDSDGNIYKELAQITQIEQKQIEFAFNYQMTNQQIEFLNIIKALHEIGKSI